MKILFVSAVFPYPLRSGGQIRIYNLLKLLSRKHDITLCTFIRSHEEELHSDKLSFCKSVRTVLRGKALQVKYLIPALFTNKPWLLSTYDNPQMRQVITEELTNYNYDCMHIEPFYVYPSIPKTKVPIVVCEHNIEYEVYGEFIKSTGVPIVQRFMRWDVEKIKTWEESVWKTADHIIAVSHDDAQVIKKHKTSSSVTVVPNGVDTKVFQVNTTRIKSKNLRCLFVGDYAWFPNREAIKILASVIWPDVIKKHPDATLSIVGRNMDKKIMSINGPGIFIKGEVPFMNEEYAHADVLLAPMTIGGGTKFKILEAMASGVVVITTKEGAFGLPVTDGKELFIVKSYSDYAKRLCDLVDNPGLVDNIRTNARECVKNNYDWISISKKLETVWQSVI